MKYLIESIEISSWSVTLYGMTSKWRMMSDLFVIIKSKGEFFFFSVIRVGLSINFKEIDIRINMHPVFICINISIYSVQNL